MTASVPGYQFQKFQEWNDRAEDSFLDDVTVFSRCPAGAPGLTQAPRLGRSYSPFVQEDEGVATLRVSSRTDTNRTNLVDRTSLQHRFSRLSEQTHGSQAQHISPSTRNSHGRITQESRRKRKGKGSLGRPGGDLCDERLVNQCDGRCRNCAATVKHTR